ncbi:glutamate receptor-like protein, partial [Trifolium pratense]
MEGVLGVRTYIPKTNKLDDFGVRWKRKFISDNPTLVDINLNIFGIWAYDATIALAMAIEKVGIGNTKFGYKLSEALSNTRFNGLSGDFKVVDGKLQTPIFEIINVIGHGEKRVGFWTPYKGLTKNLDTHDMSNNNIYSSSKNDIGSIIWPGYLYSIPKGWEIPTIGKKLKIGVPIKSNIFLKVEDNNYTEFLKVTYDHSTNTTQATGFCIDVFLAVLKILPYDLPHEFVPYANHEGQMAGTYDDLISQLYHG